MPRPQFTIRALLVAMLVVGILMVPASIAVREYLKMRYIYTVEIPRLKKEGKPLPGEPGYTPLSGRAPRR